MSKEKTITIRLEKATRNTFKYQEVSEDGEAPIAGTLYLRSGSQGALPPRSGRSPSVPRSGRSRNPDFGRGRGEMAYPT